MTSRTNVAPASRAKADGRRPPTKGWPRRRQWMDAVARETRLTYGAHAWLLVLAVRSDESGKPVWGSQERMAKELGGSTRSVRRYLVEAEALGYVQVFRSKSVRGPHGRFSGRRTNRYYFTLPKGDQKTMEAPRRKRRSGYCVLKNRISHLADSNAARTTPSGLSLNPTPEIASADDALEAEKDRPTPMPDYVRLQRERLREKSKAP
jgi:hypothetical protein